LFRLDLLRAALEACAEKAGEVTDEAMAMESAGRRPRLVAGRKSNIKVTFPEDLALAGFWLSRQETER
jgi:2-C-methyl-D-erythritol 4-phosphate cytidylyltransferase